MVAEELGGKPIPREKGLPWCYQKKACRFQKISNNRESKLLKKRFIGGGRSSSQSLQKRGDPLNPKGHLSLRPSPLKRESSPRRFKSPCPALSQNADCSAKKGPRSPGKVRLLPEGKRHITSNFRRVSLIVRSIDTWRKEARGGEESRKKSRLVGKKAPN